MDGIATNSTRESLPFRQHHAFIIGINAYQKVSPLHTAVDDARELAEVLRLQHNFLVHPPLIDATHGEIRALFDSTLPGLVGKDDRVLFYFAGHGIALDGTDGPAGYLVPADADPGEAATLIPMADLQTALEALPCRHLLLVLDCCFSGAFKWSTRYRAIGTLVPKKIYRERFDRFIQDPAWQVITSAAYDQMALDVVHGKATGARGMTRSGSATPHSPFARALIDGLAGAADSRGDLEGDGVITATELYVYIRDQVEPETIDEGQRLRQTPGFFPMKKQDKGEFIFLDPHHRLNLPPIPKRSPYKGLSSFDEGDQLLFYGRDRVVRELRSKAGGGPLLVISGASGTGKSSVAKAGLLPVLRREGFHILPVMRPGAHPLAALDQALGAGPHQAQPAILLIDQFEEVITRCADPGERTAFALRLHGLFDDPRIHRIILTVRSDFEPQLNSGPLQPYWMAARYTVPPLGLEELREVVILPTVQEVLIFDPPRLVDEIIEEVAQAPGALPLLSYALNELYELYRSSGRQDRALTKADYDRLGGVMGALRTKADNLYRNLDAPEQETMRKIMLRMVSVQGDLASKRVRMEDLIFSESETPRVDTVLEKLLEARLIVKGRDDTLGHDYVEPAHDALVRAWKTLHDWVFEVGKEKLILGAKLNAAASEASVFAKSELWNNNPNLPVLEKEMHDPRQWFNAKEIAFVKKSVARRKRLSRITRGVAAVISVALLSLTVLAWVERNTARDETKRALASQERTVREVISASWKAGNYLSERVNSGGDNAVGDTWVGGVRQIYFELKPIMNLGKLMSLAPVPVFSSGPHREDFDLHAGDFGHYNPKFVDWALEHMIPAAGDPALLLGTQTVYDKYGSRIARYYELAYGYLQANPDVLQAAVTQYAADLEQVAGVAHAEQFSNSDPGMNLQEHCRKFADSEIPKRKYVWSREAAGDAGGDFYVPVVACEFWIRRHLDGTDVKFHELLERLLRTYDHDWLGSSEAHWISG